MRTQDRPGREPNAIPERGAEHHGSETKSGRADRFRKRNKIQPEPITGSTAEHAQASEHRAEDAAGGRGWHGNPEGHAEAGRKGGQKVARDREHMAAIGRKGGEAVSRDRQHMAEIGRKGGHSPAASPLPPKRRPDPSVLKTALCSGLQGIAQLIRRGKYDVHNWPRRFSFVSLICRYICLCCEKRQESRNPGVTRRIYTSRTDEREF